MSNPTVAKPLCFVLMPFGKKEDAAGETIYFDSIYEEIIRPAIVAADLEPIRADEEIVGGIIHKPMFERLVLCDYALADLTTANANVFYELGIRHGIRPYSTTAIFAANTRLPFDVTPLRGLSYELNAAGRPRQAAADSSRLRDFLIANKGKANVDSPLFQLLNDMQPPDVSRLKTDVFRDRVNYSKTIKTQLQDARDSGDGAVDALLDIQKQLGPVENLETGVVIDLLLSFRKVKAWDAMIQLVGLMSDPVSHSVLVREQFAFALNRLGDSRKAERVLTELIKQRGPSSETYGLLGRVYKDRWETERDANDKTMADALLRQAIDAYMKGFNADWRDAYPGVNAITLMEMLDEPDSRQVDVIPVVRYSVQRRLTDQTPDYWDLATMLEIEVLAKNSKSANKWLLRTLPLIREPWEPETTARNLRLIREVNESRGVDVSWIADIENALMNA